MQHMKSCPFCGVGYKKKHKDGCYISMALESVHNFAIGWKIPVYSKEQLDKAWNTRAVDGETSDGYHTFNELYHHRAVLFSKVVATAGERAWKSKLHADGTMFDGYFIAGVETPEGQATYHYEIEPYWEMFDCKEVEYAPAWDGHTPQDAIDRIERWNTRAERTCKNIGEPKGSFLCSECGWGDFAPIGLPLKNANYCPNCGARVVS